MSVPEAAELAQNLPRGETAPVFTCAQCGGCCSNITVLINAEQKATMEGWAWAANHLTRLGLSYEPIDLRRGNERWALPLKPDGTCVFLDNKQACRIQQHEGYAAKPPDCRYFPFSRRIANVATVDTSAACQTVANGLLSHIIHWQPDADSDINPEEAVLPDRINTGVGHARLTPNAYAQWLSQWGTLFLDSPETVPPEQLLRWGLAQLANAPKPLADCSSQPMPAWAQRVIPLVWGRAPYGIWTRWGMLLGDEICDPRVLGRQGVSLVGLEHVAMPVSLNLARRRFVWLLLQRKMPMVYGHSLLSQLLLATIALGLADWYARLLARMAARRAVVSSSKGLPSNVSVTQADLVLAFRVVERYYTGHQPAFPERIRRWPLKQATARWLLG